MPLVLILCIEWTRISQDRKSITSTVDPDRLVPNHHLIFGLKATNIFEGVRARGKLRSPMM